MSDKQLDLSEELGRLGLPEAAVVVNGHVWFQDLYGVRSVAGSANFSGTNRRSKPCS